MSAHANVMQKAAFLEAVAANPVGLEKTIEAVKDFCKAAHGSDVIVDGPLPLSSLLKETMEFGETSYKDGIVSVTPDGMSGLETLQYHLQRSAPPPIGIMIIS